MSIQAATSPAGSGSADPVRAVSVVSTGTVQIHPEHSHGSRKPLYWWLLTSRAWSPPRPINVYVIEHAKGLVLFDTGQDRASVTDDSYFPGGFTGVIYDRLARFDIGATETLHSQLDALGYSAKDVDTAVLSHLHQDHIGGISDLTGADLLVSTAEWNELSGFGPELRGFLREHILLPGLRWQRITFEPTHGSGSGAVHRVARPHGRRLAGPAPHSRSHRRLPVPAHPAPGKVAASAGR